MEKDHEMRIKDLEKDVELLKKQVQILTKKTEPRELNRVLGEELARDLRARGIR